MHEYSLVQALLARVEATADAHGATTVHRIRLRIGELSGVESELFGYAFEMARRGTKSAAAELEVVPVKARWVCPQCDQPIEAGAVLRCQECQVPARLVEGDELLLEQIEMDTG
jgi:hydrogenase nickel incorporation protein HypA/HybF